MQVTTPADRIVVAVPYAKGNPVRMKCGTKVAKLVCTRDGALMLGDALTLGLTALGAAAEEKP